MTEELRATVITDASYDHNTKAGAWAAWVTVSDGKPTRIKRAKVFNNLAKSPYQAELWATLNGIHLACRAGATDVLVQTDCLAVVDGHNNGKYEKQPARMGITCKITAKHVRGHTKVQDKRSWCNRWCDKEAGILMRQQRKELRKGLK